VESEFSSEKYWSREFSLNKLNKGPLRDYETALFTYCTSIYGSGDFLRLSSFRNFWPTSMCDLEMKVKVRSHDWIYQSFIFKMNFIATSCTEVETYIVFQNKQNGLNLTLKFWSRVKKLIYVWTLGATTYTRAILLSAIKPIWQKLLKIEIVKYHTFWFIIRKFSVTRRFLEQTW
jgi:hypothetical protein